MKRVLFGSMLLALVLSACSTSSTSTTTSGAPSPTSVSPSTEDAVASASPPSEQVPLPLDQARLDGTWTVKLYERKSTFESHPKRVQRGWKFTPKCKEGTCDVLLDGKVNFASEPDRNKAGAEEDFQVRLIQLGKSYGGRVTDFFASCGSKPNRDTWTFAIKVSKAEWVDNNWVATEWSGTWTRDAAPSACTGGHLQAVIRGSHPKGGSH